VVTGGTDEIRRQHGQDNVEIEFTDATLTRRNIVVAREEVNTRLTELINQGVTIHSFKEVIPRMNDIFIKLVTEEE
jgi:ABC-2 type transport system ATP-binding protein